MASYKSLSCVFLFLLFWACTKDATHNKLDIKQFQNPSSDYRVHTWWHWNGGRITKEGITRDLESMKKQGVSQATILNIGASYGEDLQLKEILFNSDEWYEMFGWALKEANRLGIHIGVHNCDGWSTTGGPWITPEKAMKKFVFSKTRVEENQKTIKLKKPFAEADFYKDVAVIAIKKSNIKNAKPLVPPTFMILNDTIDCMFLTDGDPESKVELKAGYVLELDNPTKSLKTHINIFQNYVGVFYFMSPPNAEYTIKVSDDKVHYKELTHLRTKSFFEPEIFKIPATKAKYFKIELTETHKLRPWHHMGLSELQLLGENEVPTYNPTIKDPLKKSSSVRLYKENTLTSTNNNNNPEDIVAQENIIDLTDKMQKDGTLNWKSPGGNWEVIRFGYTSRNAYTISSSKAGRGLEVDKMDTASINFHFSQFPQKLINTAGELAGNTFKFLLVDSWEAGYQTWTNSMEEKFETMRGYDMLQWIPVLCGEIVGSEEQSNAFLYDFRRTIADLLEQNFYQHYRELCHRNNLEIHAEAIYGNNYPAPPIDVLKVNGLLDMPMTEFWAQINDQSFVEYQPEKLGRPDFAVYTPNFFNVKSIGTEAYTGYAHYSESFADLKLLGDREFCGGVSQMVLHSYAHQPFERKPGFTLGNHASHFNRHNPVWQYAKGWLEYQSRIQYVLQDSKISAHILYYLGDQFPQFIANNTIDSLPETYQSVPCNFDILTQLTVKEGKIQFAETQEFSLLVLPDGEYLSFEALKQIERLAQAGAIIYGEKPLKMFSLPEKKEKALEFSELTEKMWSGYNEGIPGKNNCGNGIIFWKEPIKKLLAELEIKPDFSTQMPDAENLMFIHRNTGNADIFFVVNQTDSLLNRECFFNTNFNTPEIWNPINGEVKKPAIYAYEEEGIQIPITLDPKQSLLFIFRNRKEKEHLNAVQKGDTQLFPSIDNTFDTYVPQSYYNSKGEMYFVSDKAGRYTFKTNTGNEVVKEFVSPTFHNINVFQGKVKLHHINSERIDSMEFHKLKSFTEYDQSDIKYFSGVATYQIDFDIPSSILGAENLIYLSLGKLDASAKVILNGELLTFVWIPDLMIKVDNNLKENNLLEIELGTTCRNRFIGDFIEYGEAKNVWSTAEVEGYLNKKSELKPSGIMGPLRLVCYPLIK